ncbi:hypothetical protein Dimus_003435 [Dionaea muscipula]
MFFHLSELVDGEDGEAMGLKMTGDGIEGVADVLCPDSASVSPLSSHYLMLDIAGAPVCADSVSAVGVVRDGDDLVSAVGLAMDGAAVSAVNEVGASVSVVGLAKDGAAAMHSCAPLLPLLTGSVGTISGEMVSEEGRVLSVAWEALRPQPTDGLWQPSSSPVKPVISVDAGVGGLWRIVELFGGRPGTASLASSAASTGGRCLESTTAASFFCGGLPTSPSSCKHPSNVVLQFTPTSRSQGEVDGGEGVAGGIHEGLTPNLKVAKLEGHSSQVAEGEVGVALDSSPVGVGFSTEVDADDALRVDVCQPASIEADDGSMAEEVHEAGLPGVGEEVMTVHSPVRCFPLLSARLSSPVADESLKEERALLHVIA